MFSYGSGQSRSSQQLGYSDFTNQVWIAIYDYDANAEDELSLKFGQQVKIISTDFTASGDEGWWVGKTEKKMGVFPSSYVTQFTNEIKNFLLLNHSPNGTQDVSSSESGPSSVHVKKGISCNLREIQFDQITSKEFIGAGGFGKVYHGIFQDQDVAIKAAKINSNDDLSEIRNNVLSEARLFSLLNHKNIIGLIGVCLQDPNDLCIVLEYAKGGPLNRCLAGRQLPPSVLVDWALQIAEGMYYLHYKAPIPLVHRDLKSSNSKSKIE